IDVFSGGHALKIEARLKATLFPAVNRAFQVARAQLWLELLRGEANERLRTGLEQMKPEQVVSHVLALLDNLQPAIDVSQGVRSALPRLARQTAAQIKDARILENHEALDVRLIEAANALGGFTVGPGRRLVFEHVVERFQVLRALRKRLNELVEP